MKRVVCALVILLAVVALLGLKDKRIQRVIPPDARFNGKVILTHDVNWVVPERVFVDEVKKKADYMKLTPHQFLLC